MYLEAKTDAFQDSTADWLLPVYFTLSGAQGTARETVAMLLPKAREENLSKPCELLNKLFGYEQLIKDLVENNKD